MSSFVGRGILPKDAGKAYRFIKMATEELAAKLARRTNIIDQAEEGLKPDLPSLKVFNPYTEFKEFSRKEIQHFQKMFNK